MIACVRRRRRRRRPLLEYGVSVWDPHNQKDIDQLERIQKNVTPFITADYKSMTPGTVSKLLKKCNLPPLQERRRHLRLTLYYRIVQGLIPALPPEKFLQQHKPGKQIRTRQLVGKLDNPVNKYARHSNRSYVVTHCNTEERKKILLSQNNCGLEQTRGQCGARE